MTDFARLRGDYLAHVEEAHEAEMTIAQQRDTLEFAERDMIRIEDEIERAVDDEGQPRVQGKNAEQRAAHKRQLCEDDSRWTKARLLADLTHRAVATTTADLHRAERLMRLARQEMDWLIAMAKREEVAV